jgi:hypothetical protein
MALLKYTVNFSNVNSNGEWRNVVINLPAGLTIQERKLHRSCLEYTINGGYVYDTNQNVRVKFGTAPQNWAVKASIRRARNHWLKMHKQLLENNPSLKPKWHDFKMMLVDGQSRSSSSSSPSISTYNVPEDIFDANLPHEEKGITFSVFTTENGVPGTLQSGEYLVDNNKDEFTCHLLGDHLTETSGDNTGYYSIGALQSWISSRPDLEPVSTISDNELDAMEADPLTLLFNDGDADEEIIENFSNAVENDGDQDGDMYPMYHLQNPPNQIQEVASAACTGSAPISYFTGFKAMLGQVFCRVYVGRSGAVDFMFDVDPRGQTI